jgi:hypothetical protein
LNIPEKLLQPKEEKIVYEPDEKPRKKRRLAIKLNDNDDNESVTSFDSGLTGMTGFT